MKTVGYLPLTRITHWRAKRNAAAKAFDAHWDNLMFRLVKAGKMIAQFNHMFAEEGTEVSELLRLVQQCIEPVKTEQKIHPRDSKQGSPVV